MTMASSRCLSAGLCVSCTVFSDRPVGSVNCVAHFDSCALCAQTLLPHVCALRSVRIESASLRFRSLMRCVPLFKSRWLFLLVRDGLGWLWLRFFSYKVRKFCCKLSNLCTCFINSSSFLFRFEACALLFGSIEIPERWLCGLFLLSLVGPAICFPGAYSVRLSFFHFLLLLDSRCFCRRLW